MSSAGAPFATIGFKGQRDQTDCWQVAPLDRPKPPVQAREPAPEPSCSPALRRWLALLARDRRPSPYRVSRVAS